MSIDEDHFRKLERMYLSAPINRFFEPTIHIAHGTAEVRMRVKSDFFHAASAVHGAVYFKMLDDAAFFATNSVVTDVFVLTANFTVNFLRPITGGEVVARGSILSPGTRQFLAEARLFDEGGRLVGHGSGTFTRSRIALDSGVGYGFN